MITNTTATPLAVPGGSSEFRFQTVSPVKQTRYDAAMAAVRIMR